MKSTQSETELFNLVFENCVRFKNEPSQPNYTLLFESYLTLGLKLGFTEQDVFNAYMKKNEVNYERQKSGY